MVKNWVLRRGRHTLLDFEPTVFLGSAGLILMFVAVSLWQGDAMASYFAAVHGWIAEKTGWLFVAAVNIFLAYCLYLAFGRFRHVRIGGPAAKPEFSRLTWFSMLFSAGMGIGLLFYGVAEPIMHLATPPHGAQPSSAAAARDAMQTTYLHWGLHAWAIYALMGLALAYFSFNRGKPLSIRILFEPLLGDRVYGPIGHLIDILATVATLFGVATSLGLGAIQVNAGLDHLAGFSASPEHQIILIAGITLIATASVVSGLKRGIRRLSELNAVLGLLLLALVLALGPTVFIMNGLIQNVGGYLDHFLFLSSWDETYTGGTWQNNWTIFYWGWWIAWSPFVGLFIARISRGRTVREFIFGVLLAPTLFTFLWLSVFGNSAIYLELFRGGGMIDAVSADLARSLYIFIERLMHLNFDLSLSVSLSAVIGGLVTLTIVSFFVTSSDSGSLVIDVITAGGRLDPPVSQRIFWALAEGVVAAMLLLGGQLIALQTAAIASGLPFVLLLLALVPSLNRALKHDNPLPATGDPGATGLRTPERDAPAVLLKSGIRR